MDLLERYLAQVSRYLPKKEKQDILDELRSLLLENYDIKLEQLHNEEEAMIEVIKELGKPKEVAIKYKNEQPLLSSEIEPLAYLVMKITAISLPAAILLGKTIDFIQQEQFTTIGLLLEYAYTIPQILNALFMALVMIFFVFMVIDRKFGTKINLLEVPFDPKNLPPVAKKEVTVSRFESLIGVVFSIIFLYIINYQPGLIVIYYDGVREPVLNSNFEKLLPFLNISTLFGLGLHIYFGIKGRKHYISGTLFFFQSVLGAVVIIFMAQGDIFNVELLENLDLGFLVNMFTILLTFVGIIGILGAVVEYVKLMLALTK